MVKNRPLCYLIGDTSILIFKGGAVKVSTNITVRYIIPIMGGNEAESTIAFYRWLPTRKEDALIVKKDNHIVRLWIDNSCIRWGALGEEEIKNWVNIPVSKVYIDVEIQDLPDELVRFIYDESDRPKEIHHGIKPGEENYDELNSSYKNIGKEVLQSALEVYNRFIAFARNNKGQYWLSERKFDEKRISSMNIEFRSKVCSNNYDWVRWCPPFIDVITLDLGSESEETSIKKEEWKEINQFISGNSRPNLALELLANAQSLLYSDHRRSAIVEAVSALEVAIYRFADAPKISASLPDEQKERIYARGLGKTIEKIGLLPTVNYILPVLFAPTILPDEILSQCREAIEIRNNIVHNGYRDIEEQKARASITAVMKTCKVILEYTM